MKITEQHTPVGVYTTIDHEGVELTVRTDHGHLTELRLLAVEYDQQAAHATRTANLIREACKQIAAT